MEDVVERVDAEQAEEQPLSVHEDEPEQSHQREDDAHQQRRAHLWPSQVTIRRHDFPPYTHDSEPEVRSGQSIGSGLPAAGLLVLAAEADRLVVDADAIVPALEADFGEAVFTPDTTEVREIEDQYGSLDAFSAETGDGRTRPARPR